MQATTNAAGRFDNLPAVNANGVGGQVMIHLQYFNTFAKGCALHPHAAAHSSWNETVTDPLFGTRTFSFTGAGNGAVVMEGDLKNQCMTQAISVNGSCDPASGLVVTYHEDVNNAMTSGPPSSITRDLKLRQ